MNKTSPQILEIVKKHGLAIHKLKETNLSLTQFRKLYKDHIKSFKFDNSEYNIKQILDISYKNDYMLKVRTKKNNIENIEVPKIDGNLYMCIKDYEYYLNGKVSMLKELAKRVKLCEMKKEKEDNATSSQSSDESEESQYCDKKTKKKNKNVKKVTFVTEHTEKEIDDDIELDEGFFECDGDSNLGYLFSDEKIDILESDSKLGSFKFKKATNPTHIDGKSNCNKRKFNELQVTEKLVRCESSFFDENSFDADIDDTKISNVNEFFVTYNHDNLKKSKTYLEEIYDKVDADYVDYADTFDI